MLGDKQNNLNEYAKNFDKMSSQERINYIKEHGFEFLLTNMVGMPKETPIHTLDDDGMEL